MKNSVKFTFDTDFDDRNDNGADARARKSFSTDEIEKLKRDAREEGRKNAEARHHHRDGRHHRDRDESDIGQHAVSVHSVIGQRPVDFARCGVGA